MLGDGNPDTGAESDEGLNRRSVLGSIATGVSGSVIALSGPVGAVQTPDQDVKQRLKEVQKEYSNVEAVRDAVKENASDLLNELSSRGLIESASIESLPVDTLLPERDYADSVEGASVIGIVADDTPTAHIMIRKDLGDRKLAVVVEPHVGRSFATVSSTDTESSDTEFIHTDATTSSTCTCYVGEACIVSCHTTDGCSCANFEVKCCPDCCNCVIGDQVSGGCVDCYSSCTAATNCSC